MAALQKLQDSLAAMTGYGVMLLSCDGAPYTPPSGPCPPKLSVHRQLREQIGGRVGGNGRISGNGSITGSVSGNGYMMALHDEWLLCALPARFHDVLLGYWALCCPRAVPEQELRQVALHLDSLNLMMEQMFEWEEDPAGSSRQDAKKKKEEKDMMRNLQTLLQEAHKRRGYMSLAVVSVGGGAADTARRGNALREQLLARTEEAMRAVVRADDVVGRLQEDMFMVALPGCAKQLAEQRIWQGKQQLEQMRIAGALSPLSFRFGLAENSELPFDKNAQRYARMLLELARQRLGDAALQMA